MAAHELARLVTEDDIVEYLLDDRKGRNTEFDRIIDHFGIKRGAPANRVKIILEDLQRRGAVKRTSFGVWQASAVQPEERARIQEPAPTEEEISAMLAWLRDSAQRGGRVGIASKQFPNWSHAKIELICIELEKRGAVYRVGKGEYVAFVEKRRPEPEAADVHEPPTTDLRKRLPPEPVPPPAPVAVPAEKPPEPPEPEQQPRLPRRGAHKHVLHPIASGMKLLLYEALAANLKPEDRFTAFDARDLAEMAGTPIRGESALCSDLAEIGYLKVTGRRGRMNIYSYVPGVHEDRLNALARVRRLTVTQSTQSTTKPRQPRPESLTTTTPDEGDRQSRALYYRLLAQNALEEFLTEDDLKILEERLCH